MYPRWRHWGLEVHVRLRADLQADYWNDAVWHLKESLALQKTHQHCKRERGMHSTHTSKPAITAYRIHTHTVHYAGILPMDPIRAANSCLRELGYLLIKPSNRNHLKCLTEKTLIFTPNNTLHLSIRVKIINRLIINMENVHGKPKTMVNNLNLSSFFSVKAAYNNALYLRYLQ